MLEELHRQSPEGRRRKLRTYANVGLLCIDEVGYLSFDDKAADLLYEVVNRRYERKPLILTTNLLCGAPHKRFNAESIVMRSGRLSQVCQSLSNPPRRSAPRFRNFA